MVRPQVADQVAEPQVAQTRELRWQVVLAVALFTLVALPAISGVVGQSGQGSPNDAAELLKRRFIAYTGTFAQRFKLQPQRPEPALGKGLEAIEIGIEQRPESNAPSCYVALYLSSTVPIRNDFGTEVSAHVLDIGRHFFLRARPDGSDARQVMMPEDALHLLNRQSRYFRQIGFTTTDYVPDKIGGRISGSIDEEVRDLFPGINYIRTRACIPAWMISHGKGVDVGIRRAGAPDYTRVVGPWRDEHFTRISLPGSLLEAAKPTLQAFEQHVQKLTDEHNRMRRGSANKKQK